MAEKNATTGGDDLAAQRPLTLHRLYLKDVSFESPNAPGIFSERLTEHSFKVDFQTSHSDLGDGTFEVVLHMTVQAMSGQRTMFLVELAQAGVFQIAGVSPEQEKTMLKVACPRNLFPFARQVITSLALNGGFPPLLVQMGDFAALRIEAERNAGDGSD